MSFGYGPAKDKNEMISLIQKAVDLKVTFFDSTEVYGPLTNEELVGKALAPFIEKVAIATKFRIRFDHDEQLLNSKPETIRKSVEGSLRWLNVETIDMETFVRDVTGTLKELSLVSAQKTLKSIRYW